MEQVQWLSDILAPLGAKGSLGGKLEVMHGALRVDHPHVDRMALALFDAGASRVRTFLQSQDGALPFSLYDTLLEDAPALAQLAEGAAVRVVNDLRVFDGGLHHHTRALRQAGFGSSLAMPFRWQGRLEAFLFFNSRQSGVFTEPVVASLCLWGHLAGVVVMTELTAVRALMAALRTTSRLVHLKDPETGGHLERMAAFSRLIALELGRCGVHPFTDAEVTALEAFAPMHDVGKIGIPDAVLLKPGRLDEGEQAIMRRHPGLGGQIVDAILEAFGADHLDHVDLLRQVTEGHHEMLDGSGYPRGLSGAAVPMASRIIAVADIFDALTSHRPYKDPWSNEAAFAYLRRQAWQQLDAHCVEALVVRQAEVEAIQARFRG